MTSVQSTATAKLQASKDADVVIGLGAPITLTLLKSVADAGSSAKVASFDLNADLAQKIVDGAFCSPWTSSRGCRATWPSTRCGRTSAAASASAAARRS